MPAPEQFLPTESYVHTVCNINSNSSNVGLGATAHHTIRKQTRIIPKLLLNIYVKTEYFYVSLDCLPCRMFTYIFSYFILWTITFLLWATTDLVLVRDDSIKTFLVNSDVVFVVNGCFLYSGCALDRHCCFFLFLCLGAVSFISIWMVSIFKRS